MTHIMTPTMHNTITRIRNNSDDEIAHVRLENGIELTKETLVASITLGQKSYWTKAPDGDVTKVSLSLNECNTINEIPDRSLADNLKHLPSY